MRTRFNESISAGAVVALACLGALALGVWSAYQDPPVSAILVMGIGVVIVLPVVFRALQGRFDIFEPIVVFALGYGAMFVIRPAAMIADNDYSLVLQPSIDLRPVFNRMLILALLGAVSFVIGYALPLGRRWADSAPRPPRRFDRETATFVALMLSGVGVLSFLWFVARGGGLGDLAIAFGGRSQALETLTLETPKYLLYGSLLLVGSALLLFSLFRQRRTDLMLALTVVVAVLATLVHGSSGNRSALLPLAGGILLFWFVSRGRRPRLLTAAVVITLALVVSAALGYGRAAQYHGAGTSATAGADYKAGLRQALSSPGAPLKPITKTEDGGMAPWLAGSMTVIPERMDFGYGSYLATDAVTRWVPRQLWPGKPEPPQTPVSDQIVPGSRSVQVHPAYSVLMHAYLDFGMFGALWLLVFGVILRALFEWFSLHRDSIPAMVIFSLGVVLTPSALRDNPVDTLVLIGVVFLPIALAYHLTQRRVQPEARIEPAR